ncbi:hypothetical protein [Prochlorococcus marinus]|nr:hypothetical protein [Prochlorococcus marinus]
MIVQLISIADRSQGVDPASTLGLLIISFGIIFTIGLPLLLILKGKKE